MLRKLTLIAAMCALGPLAACATDGASGGKSGGASTAGTPATGAGAGSGGSASSGGASTSNSGAPQIPTLVSVNVQNVLNDLSVKLNIDRNNIPATVQVPVNVAADVCGVSVSVLAVSGGGQASCNAKVASNALAQIVQQQMAAGGSVGGGSQGGANASTGGTSTGGAATGGATGTGGTSTGGTDNKTSGQ